MMCILLRRAGAGKYTRAAAAAACKDEAKGIINGRRDAAATSDALYYVWPISVGLVPSNG